MSSNINATGQTAPSTAAPTAAPTAIVGDVFRFSDMQQSIQQMINQAVVQATAAANANTAANANAATAANPPPAYYAAAQQPIRNNGIIENTIEGLIELRAGLEFVKTQKLNKGNAYATIASAIRMLEVMRQHQQ